ncbi:MAG: diguanylate cyclase [Gammaproteobacteria bacterium]|nr:diguanylate cyclase [Gammaproteobacteria bacterium]
MPAIVWYLYGYSLARLQDTQILRDSAKIIRALYQISTEHHLGFEHQILKILTIGRRVFDMEIGLVAKIEGDQYTLLHVSAPDDVDLKSGETFTLGNTYCSQTIKSHTPLAINHVKNSSMRTHPAYKEFALESYIGTAIIVKGRVFGTLNFSSPTPRKNAFSETDTDAIQLMALWIGSEFDRLDNESRLQTAYDNLKAAEERFRLGIEASPSAMLITNIDGLIVYANRIAESVFGYSSNELLNQPIEVLVPTQLRKSHSEERKHYKKTPTPRPMGSRRDLMALKKNGDIFPAEIGLNPIQTPEGTLILCAVQDITERKRYEDTILSQASELKRVNEQLAELATTDSLTGIANRRAMMTHFEILLAQASRSGQPISIVLLDIDHFKSYNDKLGHLAGDEALKITSRSIVKVARRSDIVARYGGEEFVLLLPDTDAPGALQIAERCREIILNQTDSAHPLTASFGVATIIISNPPNSPLPLIAERLIEEADRALYSSKESGRNKVTHFSDCSNSAILIRNHDDTKQG